MRANIVDLRYRMNDVLKALDRNEEVTILYYGQEKGVIKPIQQVTDANVENHPMFGVYGDDKQTVSKTMSDLRGGRYDAI
ncbi:MAG: type II toxin-antitoxin system Phd/YefM family antitoxin [Pseudomonadota bacterium]